MFMKRNGKLSVFQLLQNFKWSATALSLVAMVSVGCSKQEASAPASPIQSKTKIADLADTNTNVVNQYTGLSKETVQELQSVRSATASYQNINNAFKDHYEDIGVVMEGMGYHFMKKSIVDTVFDVRKPEVLVYNKTVDGNFELVAVEYAQPLSDTPPQGFTGDNDVWDHNTAFGLWLLHAWVWKFNPAGVFHPTNPLVHVVM